jgi:hypothetical protein
MSLDKPTLFHNMNINILKSEFIFHPISSSIEDSTKSRTDCALQKHNPPFLVQSSFYLCPSQVALTNIKQWKQRGLKRDIHTAAAASAGLCLVEKRERRGLLWCSSAAHWPLANHHPPPLPSAAGQSIISAALSSLSNERASYCIDISPNL